MRLRIGSIALSLVLVACGADLVIPSEEEAASAGEAAAAATQAFVGVFEEAIEAERAELEASFVDDSEPLFPTTTVDPLDLFDPINDCRWSEAGVVTAADFDLVLPSFVAVTRTSDSIGSFHASYDYGDCAPLVGDLQVLDAPGTPEAVVGAQLSAYRAIGDLEVVSEGAVSLPSPSGVGFLSEARTGGETHHLFLAGTSSSGAVVVLTVHVPLDRWVDASEVALDLLRGLSLH